MAAWQNNHGALASSRHVWTCSNNSSISNNEQRGALTRQRASDISSRIALLMQPHAAAFVPASRASAIRTKAAHDRFTPSCSTLQFGPPLPSTRPGGTTAAAPWPGRRGTAAQQCMQASVRTAWTSDRFVAWRLAWFHCSIVDL